MKIGYVRVSTKEQNTARQEELMKALGADKVFIDRMSGKNTERPALQEMMGFVREGDSVIVESISRFARNTKDLLELTEQLNNKHVQFVSQKESIDTNTASGKFMLTIFGVVAELEREYIKQRQREGIEIAKEQGKYKGRPSWALTKTQTAFIKLMTSVMIAIAEGHWLFMFKIAYLPKATVQAAIGSVPLSLGLPCGNIGERNRGRMNGCGPAGD